MNPQDFCYWLQGFAELTDKAPTQAQWKAIREHLALAFVKETSVYDWQKLTAIPPATFIPQFTC